MLKVNDEKARKFSSDIRRTMLLSRFIAEWGQPLERTISTNKNNGCSIEVYEFRGNSNVVSRFVTIGVSGLQTKNRGLASWELMFCLPNNLGGSKSSDIVNYLLDISVYTLRDDVTIEIGSTIPESPLAPIQWSTKAILFDEARGEPEDMSCFQIGQQTVELFWLIPLMGTEYQCIKEHGLELFDTAVSNTGISMLDVNRKPIV